MIQARQLVWSFALASLHTGCAPDSSVDLSDDEPSSEIKGALSQASGKIFGTDGAGLNVRSAPNTQGSVVKKLADGSTVTIECQVNGQSIGGNSLWDYLPKYDGYALDTYVNTGYDGRIPGIPDCNQSGGGGECDGLDYAGECQGATLRWCEDDTLHAVNCAASGKTCAFQNDSVGYNCMASSGGGGGSSSRLHVSGIVGGVDYYISQEYGPSDFDGGYEYCQVYGDWGGQNVHCGLDVAIPYGTPLYIPSNAVVIHDGDTPYFEDSTNSSAGELRIRLSNGTEIILGHMSSIAVSDGQSVTKGQYAGHSGNQNGDHVHLEVRVPDAGYDSGFRTVDPLTYFGQ